jgi:terminase small subunit-like protein
MAAKPVERFVKRQIAEQGGWDRILERLASGETVADIARTLVRPDGQAISRAFLSRLLHADAARSAAVLQARSEGSDAMVDEGLHLVDTAEQERDAIQKAKVRAELRLKVAGLVNRERWGESRQAVNVQIMTGDVHLGALRHREVGTAETAPVIASQACGTDTVPQVAKEVTAA